MNKLLIISGLLITVGLAGSRLGTAQDKPVAVKYEYAVVKWDGPDRLYYNLPDKFELIHLHKAGVAIPREAQLEEWCLAYAANKMAQEGWEAINLNSRRILFRRAR